MTVTVADIGEHALIARLSRQAGRPPAWITLGIGDDAAIIEAEPGTATVVTTDSLVEGVHFTRGWTAAEAIGHKALAVNLSDLAAMGARPQACLLSLALPADYPIAEFDAVIGGLVALGAATHAPLVGGNLTRSPAMLVVDVTALGSVRTRRALRRGNGRPGDELYVTGTVGAAAAGRAMLQAGADRATLDERAEACVGRYERPEPRLRCGLTAARSRAVVAAIDLSDGLADAVRQLAEASRTGAVVTAAEIPVDPGARAWWERQGADPVAQAICGGEDYELLFAVSPKKRRQFLSVVRQWQGVPATRIGRLSANPGVWLERPAGLEPLGPGFVHF